MATFVSDALDDTDGVLLESHTGATGATWTKHPSYASGSADFVSNRVANHSSSATVYYPDGDPATAEYDVQGEMHVESLGDQIPILMFRLATLTDTMYIAKLSTGGGTSATLSWNRRIAGVEVTLQSTTVTIAAGSDYTIKIEGRTAAKKVYFAGVLQLTDTDDTITGKGKSGLGFLGTVDSSIRQHWNNFSATDAAAVSNNLFLHAIGEA